MDLIENANENDEKKETQTQIDSEHSTTSSTTTTATASSTPTTDTTVVTTRTQPFSFASSYSSSVLQANTSLNKNTAFTVLNNEEFFTVGGKPNAIVRPIPRNINLALSGSREKWNVPGLDGNGNGNTESSVGKIAISKSTDADSFASVAHADLLDHRQERLHFSEELNRKLRYLRNRDTLQTAKSKHYSKSDNNESFSTKRPLFITTVPTGVFLPPAPLPMPPSYKRHVYAYSSHPVIFTETKYYNTNNENNNSNNSSSSNNNNNKISNINNSSNKKSLNSSKDKLSMGITTIGLDDKTFVTNTKMSGGNVTTTARLNGTSLPAKTTTDPADGVHISKQQFQQQIRESRHKSEKPYINVMYDRRVCRGSNFGHQAQILLEDVSPFDRAAELRRRRLLTQKCRNRRNVIGTPPPVSGRRHEVVQTEKYLEELFMKPSDISVDTQTDLFLERPPTPPYVPAKIGIDVATEIGDGELFHFDAEAQPIIDVLVDSCVEQSILEISHEQELEALREKQEKYLAEREAKLAELRRLEAEEIRIQAEKERRLQQDVIVKELDDGMQKGITAAKLLQGHIASLLPEILDSLEPASDNVKKETLMRAVCPWLSSEVANEVGQIVDSREILTVIIQEVIKQRAEVYAGYSVDVPPLEIESNFGGEEEGEEEELCIDRYVSEETSKECSSIETIKMPKAD